MNIRVKLTPEETKARIVEVAEEHFRRIGYAKTAVADLAVALGMSSANIYRFFPSKSAINDAICEKLLAESDAMVDAIVGAGGSAADRVARMIEEVHTFNRTRLTDERRIHDMVEIAMEERWPAIDAHCERMGQQIGRLLVEGMERGEFGPMDVEETAETIFSCLCGLFHPVMIAEDFDNHDPEGAVKMGRFILRALTNGAPVSAAPVSAAPVSAAKE